MLKRWDITMFYTAEKGCNKTAPLFCDRIVYLEHVSLPILFFPK